MAQVTNLPAPVLRPAMTVSNGSTVVAWWGASGTGTTVGLTVAHISNPEAQNRPDAKNGVPTVALPLGHAPRDLTLYPAGSGAVQALWLDNGDLPDETRLFDAFIAADLSLQRGPTLISTLNTIRYAATALSSGALAVLWTANTGLAAQPVYLQTIDAAGRAGNAALIDKDARFPALAVDERAALYAAWLEPQPDEIETVEFARYPGNYTALTAILSNSAPLPLVTPIGIIAPDPTSVLDSFALGIEAGYGYVVWGMDSPPSPSGEGQGARAAAYALTFSLDQPVTARQVTIPANARWPSIASTPLGDTGGAIPIGVTLPGEQNGTPAVVWLAKDQVLRTDRLASSPGAAEQSTLTVSGNTLIAAWAALAEDGAAGINLLAWRFGPLQ